jgi:predicted ATPase
MLIAVSGSQGAGKSTILSNLKNMGYHTIERKTSRSLLSELNVTLDEVNNSIDLSVQFQELVISRKYEDEEEARLSTELWFTERSYADLFTYALLNLGKVNIYDDWLNNYHDRCSMYQMSYYKVMYLVAGHFNVEKDGVRGINKHYSRMIDNTMLDITNGMNSKSVIINTKSLDTRLEVIVNESTC